MLRKYIVGLAGAGLAVGASTGIAVAANGSPPANAPSATHSARPAAVRGITGTTAQAPETSTTVPRDHDAVDHDAANHDAADHEHAYAPDNDAAANHDAANHDAADHDAADHDAVDHDAANHDAANHEHVDAANHEHVDAADHDAVDHEHAGAPVTSTTLAMNAITGVHRGRDGRDDHNQVDQNDNRGRGSNASHGGGHGPN